MNSDDQLGRTRNQPSVLNSRIVQQRGEEDDVDPDVPGDGSQGENPDGFSDSQTGGLQVRLFY